MQIKMPTKAQQVSLLLLACLSISTVAASAADLQREGDSRDFESMVLVGENGRVERFDSSFVSETVGQIQGVGFRRPVGAANLSWDNESLLVGVGEESGIVQYSLKDMSVKTYALIQLPEGPGWLDYGHIPEVILPLAGHQVFVRDEGYASINELGRRSPAIHCDLESQSCEIVDAIGLGPLYEYRISPDGTRFVQFRSGVAAMVEGKTGDVIRQVELPEFSFSLTEDPKPGRIFPLGYEFDWEQEVLDFWWISMAPGNAGELEHVLVCLKTGEVMRQDSMRPWPELPDFERNRFAESSLSKVLQAYAYRFHSWQGKPLLRLKEATMFAKMYVHPEPLYQLPSIPVVVFLTPEAELMLACFPVRPNEHTVHVRVVVINIDAGTIEADFVFEDVLKGVFFPKRLGGDQSAAN